MTSVGKKNQYFGGKPCDTHSKYTTFEPWGLREDVGNPSQLNVVTGMERVALVPMIDHLQWFIVTFTSYPFSDAIHPKVGLFPFLKGEVPVAEGWRPVFRMGDGEG